MAFSLACALPLRTGIARLIDRRLFPEKLRFHQTIRAVSQVSARVDLEAVLFAVSDTLGTGLDVRSVAAPRVPRGHDDTACAVMCEVMTNFCGIVEQQCFSRCLLPFRQRVAVTRGHGARTAHGRLRPARVTSTACEVGLIAGLGRW